MADAAGCRPCAGNARYPNLPPRELIAADKHWRAAHAAAVALPGWLVLLARRHVTTPADLTEAAGLGRWQARLSRALAAATGCPRTYLVEFSESVTHLHVHVVPRAADLPPDRIGPGIFAYLGPAAVPQVPDAEQDRIALAVRAHLE